MHQLRVSPVSILIFLTGIIALLVSDNFHGCCILIKSKRCYQNNLNFIFKAFIFYPDHCLGCLNDIYSTFSTGVQYLVPIDVRYGSTGVQIQVHYGSTGAQSQVHYLCSLWFYWCSKSSSLWFYWYSQSSLLWMFTMVLLVFTIRFTIDLRYGSTGAHNQG